jgi:hypothetical protein
MLQERLPAIGGIRIERAWPVSAYGGLNWYSSSALKLRRYQVRRGDQFKTAHTLRVYWPHGQ